MESRRNFSYMEDRYHYGFYFVKKSIFTDIHPSDLSEELKSKAIVMKDALTALNLETVSAVEKRTYLDLDNYEEIKSNVIDLLAEFISTPKEVVSWDLHQSIRSLYFHYKFLIKNRLWFIESPRYFNKDLILKIELPNMLTQSFDIKNERNLFGNYNQDEPKFAYLIDNFLTEKLQFNLKKIKAHSISKQEVFELDLLNYCFDAAIKGDLVILINIFKT